MNKRGFGLIAIIAILVIVVGGGYFLLNKDSIQLSARPKPYDRLPTHLECIDFTCSIVQGNGTDQCSPQGSGCGLTCTDTDGGNNPLVFGTVVGTNSSGEFEVDDRCANEDILYEGHCPGGGPQFAIIDCEGQYGTGYSCQKGVCQAPENETCSDTDVNSQYPDGVNPFLLGTVTSSNDTVLSDFCASSSSLYEYSCNPSDPELVDSTVITCASLGDFLCDSGECVSNNETNTSLPDLIVSDAWKESSALNDSSGNYTVALSATIKNIGESSFSGSFLTRFEVIPFGGIKNYNTQPIAPGQERNVSFNFELPQFDGYTLNLTADINDVITESSESNNEFSIGFNVP